MFAKLNSLVDHKVIESLYHASQAGVQVELPAPVANDSWPQSGGFANYAMQHLAVGEAPHVIWSADVGAGSTSSRVLTTPPVVADGKVFAKDAQSTVSAYDAETGTRTAESDRVTWLETLSLCRGAPLVAAAGLAVAVESGDDVDHPAKFRPFDHDIGIGDFERRRKRRMTNALSGDGARRAFVFMAWRS